MFGEVGEGYDVARVGGRSGLVGYPYLDALDADAAGNGGQRLHVLVVCLTEMVAEVEVLVLLVVGG